MIEGVSSITLTKFVWKSTLFLEWNGTHLLWKAWHIELVVRQVFADMYFFNRGQRRRYTEKAQYVATKE